MNYTQLLDEYTSVELAKLVADLLEALEKIKEACYSGGRYKISQVDAIATEAIEKSNAS